VILYVLRFFIDELVEVDPAGDVRFVRDGYLHPAPVAFIEHLELGAAEDLADGRGRSALIGFQPGLWDAYVFFATLAFGSAGAFAAFLSPIAKPGIQRGKGEQARGNEYQCTFHWFDLGKVRWVKGYPKDSSDM